RIGRLEIELGELGEVEPRARRRNAARPAERVGNRRAHVGRAELRQHRAVAVIDQAVYHRLRMHHDLDLARAEAEEMMRLDHLEALVHHGRGIDRDLGAHAPVGMRYRLFRRDVAHRLARTIALAWSKSKTWKIALCSLSTGSKRAPWRFASAVTSAPAQTSTSLLASATMAPRRTASSVGAKPAAPTIAAIIQSAGRAAASTTAAAPAPTSMPLPASASLSAP